MATLPFRAQDPAWGGPFAPEDPRLSFQNGTQPTYVDNPALHPAPQPYAPHHAGASGSSYPLAHQQHAGQSPAAPAHGWGLPAAMPSTHPNAAHPALPSPHGFAAPPHASQHGGSERPGPLRPSRPPPTEAELSALRTRVANQAALLAEGVTHGFDGFHLGADEYSVELTSPEGPSTGGGKQARQCIRLVPRDPRSPSIVVGAVDPVASTGEVRTFEHVRLLHRARFARPLEMTVEEYEEFIRKLDIVLSLVRIRPRRVPPPPELLERPFALPEAPLQSSTSSGIGPLLLTLAFFLAAAAGFFLLRANLH